MDFHIHAQPFLTPTTEFQLLIDEQKKNLQELIRGFNVVFTSAATAEYVIEWDRI